MSQKAVLVFRVVFLVTLVVVTYFALTPIAHPLVDDIYDKYKHIFAFVVLAFLLDFSFPDIRFGKQEISWLLVYGLTIEIIQYFLPTRFFSMLDILADGIGLMVYKLSLPLVYKFPNLNSGGKVKSKKS